MVQLFGIVGFLIAVTSVALGVRYGLNWADLNKVWQKELGLVSAPLILGVTEAFFIFSAVIFVRDRLAVGCRHNEHAQRPMEVRGRRSGGPSAPPSTTPAPTARCP
jgi:hypothetical protein